MLDIKWIRENPEALAAALNRRGWTPDSGFLAKLRDGWPRAAEAIEQATAEDKRGQVLAALRDIDFERREVIKKTEAAQQARNQVSREIGKAKAAGDEATVQRLLAEVAEYKKIEEQPREIEQRLNDVLAYLPNVPLSDVPDGPDEHANTLHREWGTKRQIAGAKEHFELGEALGGMDFETAAKLSGSRFVVLKGALARLERALGQFMLDLHTGEHGYTEVQPPLLVRDEVLLGTGQLPKFEADQFFATNAEFIRRAANLYLKENEALVRQMLVHEPSEDRSDPVRDFADRAAATMMGHFSDVAGVERTRLWLIPTAEVPLTNLVRDSVIDESQLPMRVTALTPCFRSEAGAAGKDTRGMLRQHQFDKVELVSITTPEASRDEHERMLVCAEEVMKRLDLHYRVMTLSTGDMGFSAQKTWDIEVWLPGQGAYREISSCSLCGDFQARRMSARYRPKEGGGKGTRFVHTLNGSGVAVGRALIAVMETYQNADGSITVPDALMPYMGGMERIGNSE